MKKYINFINEEQDQPDLRRMTGKVRCIKINQMSFVAEKGKIYNLGRMFGDPQRAVEEFGINDYLPIQCISKVEINNYPYRVSDDYNIGRGLPSFFEYFELLDNLKKITRPDMDLFNEEDWGWEETNESVGNSFNVGDRVIGVGRCDGLSIDGEIGTIIEVFYNDCKVQFDDRFSEALHSDNDLCWNIPSNKLKLFDRRGKRRIRRPDIDPYDEEDWGWEEII